MLLLLVLLLDGPAYIVCNNSYVDQAVLKLKLQF